MVPFSPTIDVGRETARRARPAALLTCAAALAVACRAPAAPPPIGGPEIAARGDAAAAPRSAGGAPPVAAEERLGADATLADYVRRAELASPGLQAAWSDWIAARERVPQAAAWPDPRLTYRHFVEEVETRVGPQRRGLELMQTVPARGRVGARERQAGHAAEQARARYEARRLALVAEVVSAFHEAYWVERAIEIVSRNLALVERLEEVARRRYAAGGTEYADVIRAQVELGRLEDRVRSLVDRRGPVAARLNAALDRPPDAPLALPGALARERLAATDEEVFAWIPDASPELAALRHELDGAAEGVELARAEGRPDWTVGVQWTETGSAVMPVAESGKDPVAVMVGLNLPLNRARYGAAEREAEARLRAASLRWDALRNELSARAADTLYRIRDAERRIELHGRTLVPLANQTLEATEVAYRGGQATFLDLVDAEQLLLELQLAYERALADHGQHRAELERLVGRTVPFEPAPSAGDAESADGSSEEGRTAGEDAGGGGDR